ncbi:MAG: right-handed parallel beta-helix repeat-containing protein [Deltaproteobacteria bacterium]|nr:right-handed parallel beta-helix repeat-containing protein [Deltaproteobacteria bacterium]
MIELGPRTVLLVVVLASCSGGPGGSDDAGADADDGFDAVEVEAPTPPEPPALPVFTPCPDGWREVEDVDTGIVTCDPWPEGGPEECGPDEAHFPGEPGCTRIGTACPTGDWADGLPTDREILYVRAGEPSGGDGTIGSPFGTIADAMAVADPMTVVALSKGTFDEYVMLRGGITLWGACVAETLIQHSVPADWSGTIIVAGSDTEVRNLSVSGPRPGICMEGASRTTLIEDVLVSQSTKFGVRMQEGHAVMRNLVVRDTAADGDGLFGRGLNVSNEATVELSRGVFERNRDTSIVVFDAGTSLVMHDVAVRDTLSAESDRGWGIGLQIQGGAHVEVTRGVFEESRETGIQAIGVGTSLDLVDVVVRDTLGRDLDGENGRGLGVQEGAQARVTRCVFERNRLYGVFAFWTGTSLELTDVVVRDTLHQQSDGMGGTGLTVFSGAGCTVTRALFARNRIAGVYATLAGSVLTMVDVIVSGTMSCESTGKMGRGLQISEGAQAEVLRGVFEMNTEIGVSALDPGTLLVMTDVAVRDTQHAPGGGMHGTGLQGGAGSRIEVTRGLFERNRTVGISAHWEDTVIVLTDVTVADTLERACAVDTCAGFGAGTGIGAFGGAHLDVSRFLITRNVLCGVQIAHGGDGTGTGSTHPLTGTVDLHDGEISHSPVGANVQDAEFDVERLMDGVTFIGNDINLDMTVLPVPDLGLEEM